MRPTCNGDPLLAAARWIVVANAWDGLEVALQGLQSVLPGKTLGLLGLALGTRPVAELATLDCDDRRRVRAALKILRPGRLQ